MSIARLRLVAIALALFGAGTSIPLRSEPPPPPPAPTWNVGDVFVAVGKGQYEVRTNAGALKQTITINLPGLQKKDEGGCSFDGQFNLLTADITNTKVIKHLLDETTGHQQSIFADTLLQAPDGHSNSLVMAVNGDVFVGNAGNPNGTGTKNLLRYRNDGLFLAPAFYPATENGGIDWVEIASDQSTIFYTSRGRLIKRFDVTSNSQGSDFVTLSGSAPTYVAYALRLLPPFDNLASGGLLVADNGNIKRIDSAGVLVATYDVDPPGNNNDENAWHALNLDPDGVHFWAGGFVSGKVYRFNLTTVPQSPTTPIAPDLGPFQTAGTNALGGICVMGGPQEQVIPLVLSNFDTSPYKLVDVTAEFGKPGATNPTDFYSLSTWRLRTNVKNNWQVVAALGFNAQTTDLACTGTSLTDFDCRFPQSPAPVPQCVPFFNNPSATSQIGLLQYQCASYRLKDVPVCLGSDPATDPNCPFADPHVPGSTDIMAEIIVNLTNPPATVFDSSAYGNDAKGSPRLYRDADSVPGNMFFDSTLAIIDWPALGSGDPNEYSPAQRRPETFGACAEIISPIDKGISSQSAAKLTVAVRTGPVVNGVCTGNVITDAATSPNNMTLAVAGTGTNHFLAVYCKIAGNSNECFELNGQTYQANVKVNEIPPDTVNPYIFAVTSVCSPSSQAQCQVKFPPVARQYFVCPSGSNCGG